MDNQVRLTAAELAEVSGAYINASLSAHVLAYFLAIVEDEDIKSVLQEGYTLSQSHMEKLQTVLQQNNQPIPAGFTKDDINLDAPRLYTDNYFLQYALQMGYLGMYSCTSAVSLTVQKDIYRLFSEGIRLFNQLHEKATDIALYKGLYLRPPIVPTPNQKDIVKKQSFLTGWFGERRPLTLLEITNLYSNMKRNQLGIATLTGYSQVAKNKDVKAYINRGIDIAKKHADIFASILKEENVPSPMGSDAMVTASANIAPFSDRLMMFHVTEMITLGITFYGMSISTNIRRDLAAKYTRLSGEIALYSEDGVNIMIENEWLEEPPRMVDREELANTDRKGNGYI